MVRRTAGEGRETPRAGQETRMAKPLVPHEKRAIVKLQMDRRKNRRAGLVVRVDYYTVDELFSEFAHNINEGGLFVETDSPREPGTTVDLQFQLPGDDDPVRVKGTVVHVSQGEGGDPPGMGIEFEDLDAPTRQRINGLVRNLRAASR
jgi:type IV pilus assembly protein PilZ